MKCLYLLSNLTSQPPKEFNPVCLAYKSLSKGVFTGAQAAYWGYTTEENVEAVLL